jgi:hypothetical protein
MNKNAKSFVVACEERFGSEVIITRDGITQVCNESGAPYPYWLVTKAQYRYDRGQYKVPPSGEKIVKSSAKIVKNPEQDCKEPELEMAYQTNTAQVLEFRQPKLIG